MSELTERHDAMEMVKTRSFSVANMHQTLIEMTREDDTVQDEYITSLIKLHARIQSTNILLEKRLPKMQNNCMK